MSGPEFLRMGNGPRANDLEQRRTAVRREIAEREAALARMPKPASRCPSMLKAKSPAAAGGESERERGRHFGMYSTLSSKRGVQAIFRICSA